MMHLELSNSLPRLCLISGKSGSRKSTEGESSTDQSSTSVLATLAALAEASGPLNATAAPSRLPYTRWY